MKKVSLLLVTGIISCWIFGVSAQTPVIITENFDGNTIKLIASPADLWEKDTNCYKSAPAAYLGMVPNMKGDVTTLETPAYNFEAYTHILLRFKHICKVSPLDIVRVEYKISGQGWREIPAETYLGKATKFLSKGFSASSYPEWQAGDSLALPNPSWFREESFDVSFEVGSDQAVQFRFVIEHGTVAGTQISYGWLLDDIEIITSTYEVKPPIVEFMEPFVKNTIYTTGPHTIKARVKTQSGYNIQTPWLVYTSTLNGISVTDSVIMKAVIKDTVWEGIIPQFVLGTNVTYSITGKDIQGNYAYTSLSYTIAKSPHNYGNNSVFLTSIDSPIAGQTVGGVNTPVRIIIRNKGDSALTSATINWSINGVSQTYSWTGNLAWDMETLINLGNYTHRSNMYDTILAWVSSPNHVTDPVLNDDTLEIISFGCSATMGGNYTVGNGGTFSNINDFITVLKDCSPIGNITLLLQTGTYTENWDLSNIGALMGNYTLTITSATANADSVILRPASGVGINLTKIRNLVIKAITVNAITGTYAVQFTDTCSDVVIRDCKLLANPTTTSSGYAPIYKASTGIATNISIINNLLDGGYYGIYFYGGPGTTASQYGMNIVFDSNTITNSYYYGTYFRNGNFPSCSYNTILSRTTSATYWYGMYIQACDGDIIGNRILQRNTSTAPYGIYLYYHNYYNTTDTALIANNEIMLYTTSSYPGIYAYSYTRAKILHNSIYMSGSGAAMGIYIYSSSYTALVVTNNNIIMESSTAYPIYVSATTYLSQYNIDYNNMYAPTNVGYAGAAKTTMSAWQQTVTSDSNSVNVRPGFIDSTINLEMSDYTNIQCNILPDVTRDINNTLRTGTYTSMGCYHPYMSNVTLKTITGWREGVVSGQSDSVKIQLENRGTDTVTSLTLNWSINGSTQTGVNWTGSLALGENLTLTLGTITYTAGTYTIKAWLSAVNGSPDESAKDDTLNVSGYACSSALNGTYSIGATGTIPSWEVALERASICGVSGDVIFEFQPGTYIMSIDLSNKSSLFGSHSLTLTSTTHNAIDVVFKTTTVGITLNNSNNIIIKDITIDATAGTYAVQFTAACTNVTIRDCKLLANPTITATGYASIYKGSSTGIVDSVFIINNLLDGGYYGIYFYGGSSSSYNKHIVFDSNTVSNQYYYGTYFYYTDLTSCSYNKVLSRTTAISTTWMGMYLYYANGAITGNRIKQQTTSITSPYGIYLRYYNYYNTTDTCLVANNEIILNATSAYYGIYAYSYTKAKILHNSIYISGTGAANGIYIYNNANNYMIIKNNNIIMEASGAYPIYLSATANISLYDMDYNNMYAPTNVGYAGAAKTTMADWQQIVATDNNSVRLRPNFVDSTINLELVNYDGLECDLLSEISTDKEAAIRGGITAMGCYRGFIIYPINAKLTNIQAEAGLILGTSNTVKAILINSGTTALTNATLHWSFNGVIQSSTGISWSGNLAPMARDTVVLGTATYTPAGYYTIKAWLHDLGSQQDMFSSDDTTEYIAYICPSAMNGLYTIGSTGTFKTFKEAMDIMSLCGVSGDVTLAFQPDTYNEKIDLKDISLLMGAHTLTLTSTTHKATDVVFQTSAVGITLNNSNNIRIEALTIDATAGTYAVQFTGACNNVTIRDCKLQANPTTTSSAYAPIYKASSTGIVDNIFIINNLLDGGYYGIYFYGGTGSGTGQYGTNIVFDSNTVSNQYYYAVCLVYGNFTSSYNTILSRIINAGSSWYGIYKSYTNGTTIGNHIQQRSNSITSPYGIYTTYYNYYNATDTGLIANNEIMLYTTGAYPGIYAYSYTKAKILHNSIYISGTGAAYGIYIYSSSYTSLIIKNNNIIMEAPGAYPIYVSATTYLSQYKMDYNNMYAPTNVGYAGGAKTTMTAWQTTVTTDKNSVRVRPAFIDSTINLELVNYDSVECNLLLETPTDKEAAVRGPITAMGCYRGFVLYSNNARLTDIQAASGAILGTSNTVKAILTNRGTTPLTDATLYWSFNDIIQSPTGVSWSGNLALKARDTIELGIVTYTPAGYYTIKAWIHDLGSSPDMSSEDDTTEFTAYICSSPMNGTYSIGTTGAFKTFKEAMEILNLCGISGDITFEIQPGTYNEFMDLKDISLLMENYNLILTSSTHNANDVVITTNNVGILLNNSNNIRIEALTIDATAGTYAIQFTGACTNVTIRDCKLLANPTVTATGYAPIYKASSTGVADSIFIINNLLDGGYHGAYLYGASSSSYNKHIVFDSNTVSNQYYYATYFYYTDFTSCSYNKILSRTANTTTTWYGLYLYYSNGTVTGNRIKQCTTAITSPYGIYLQYYNYYNTTDTGFVANNEIMLYSTGAYYGIYAYTYTRAEILHNSVYIEGTGAARGIYLYDNANNYFVVKNNNIVMQSSTAHPIYLSGITNIAKWTIDANNYYAPQYVGYAGSAQTSLSAWASVVTTDKNSVNIQPDFIDSTISLRLNNYKGFDCILLKNVPADINEQPRTSITAMGCYHGVGAMVNAMLTDITSWGSAIFSGTTKTIQVEIANKAVTTITSATIFWSLNGNTPQSYTWSGTLLSGESFSLTPGSVTFTTGNNTLKIWINSLGLLQDEISSDDSIHLEFYACNTGFSGIYTVGNAGTFSTISEALAQIDLCGLTGNVTLALQPNTYTSTIDFSNISLGGYTLILTSSTNNAADVIIQTTTTGILLSNSKDIIIEKLTINLINGSYGVRLNNPCTNIVIRDCKFLANLTTTSNNNTAISMGTSGGMDILISKNTIEGGYNGIDLTGGTNVMIDSNHIYNTYNYGITANGTKFIDAGISFNTINSDRTGTDWWGISLTASSGNITGNRISCFSKSKPKGIYLSGHNVSESDAGLVANNEIRLITNYYSLSYGLSDYTPYIPYGIRTESSSNVAFIHNSIGMFRGGNGGASIGLEILSVPNKLVTIKNNNIYLTTMGAALLYNNQVRGGRPSINIYLPSVPSQYDIDYNNIYSSSATMGHIGSTTIPTISDWQQVITTDLHSVSVHPELIDSIANLMFSNFTPFLCPSVSEVATDIAGIVRNATTLMGAYTSLSTLPFDIALQNITRMDDEGVVGQRVKFGIEFTNTGAEDIDSVTFRWSINGIVQSDSCKWIPASSFSFAQTEEVLLDSFVVSGYGTFEVVIWTETVNGVKRNDTLAKTSYIVPLAEFAEPFVANTINALSFDLYVKIREKTGALIATPVPQMTIQTILSNKDILYDTITMQYDALTGLWKAEIPKQYYGSTVSCSLTVSDTVGNSVPLQKNVYLEFAPGSETYTGYDLGIASLNGLIGSDILCSPDYVPLSVTIINAGEQDYDFTSNPLTLHIRVTTPIPFSLDTVITMDTLISGQNRIINLTDTFSLINSGQYDFKVWIESQVDNVPYDDTLLNYYVSGRFALPIDKDFSGEIPIEFTNKENNTFATWTVVPQGTKTDTVVKPVFGTDMISFIGSRGAMTTLSTRQLDLSRTVQPALSFWYFHDTIPSKDYTDVRITVDGGTTYTTLFSLRKYNPVYGWKQYDVDLPSFAINQCVVLVFEAMEKSLQANVTQYIDRIRITAKQDIFMSEIIFPQPDVCNLKNHDLKVVMSNSGDLILDYTTTPTIVTLEVKETGQTFRDTLTSGSLLGFSSDTITLATGFDFGSGTYSFKAYFSSVLDVDRQNDTIETSVSFNPGLNVQLTPLSVNNICLTGGSPIWQEITLTNTGDMDLFDINLILQIDTGETGDPAYIILTETCTDTIHSGDSHPYSFKQAYNVPWNIDYYPRIYAYLSCDSALVNATTAISECVYMKDLYMVSIDNPSVGEDKIGEAIQVKATLRNRSDIDNFPSLNMTVVVENSERIEIARFSEPTGTIGILATVSHTFSNTYVVPDDSVYYLTVYIDHNDDYLSDDTLTIKRTTKEGEKDLSIISIDNPSSGKDMIGSSVQVSASVRNDSEYENYSELRITVLVEDPQGQSIETFTEIIDTIERLSTVSHTFANTYTVPGDSVYYLYVYIDSYDNYSHNDTAKIRRETRKAGDSTSIYSTESIKGFTLGQNIPNPANNSTHIDYSIPDAGKVIFHIHSISGQLLYSQTIETARGTNSIELNTSLFAAGVYFYSMEYKGQRRVRKLTINN
jgi:Fe-S cluster biogenesis protein NfuA